MTDTDLSVRNKLAALLSLTGMREPVVAADELLAEHEQEVRRAVEPFEPSMALGWDDCDPIAACHCGARLKGDSINDALIAWGKHVTTVHRGKW